MIIMVFKCFEHVQEKTNICIISELTKINVCYDTLQGNVR